MTVEKESIVQGRRLKDDDITLIKKLLVENPSWHRTRLSQELCRRWGWYKENGQMKDMSCRCLLLKLEKLGYINLPAAIRSANNLSRNRHIEPVLHVKEPIDDSIQNLYPIEIRLAEGGYELKLFKYFMSAYHYIGFSGTVGENLKYLFFDRCSRPLGGMMFGAAAWKVQPRDHYIGWTPEVRKHHLSLLANNDRFLILPWVKVKHLASHLLGKVLRRIQADWQRKYHHPVYLLETFVERDRFQGTCYRAANWIHVGQTQGRGKLDVKYEYLLPVKDIWVYPLDKSFRQKLGGANG
jgi:hypothetical protein